MHRDAEGRIRGIGRHKAPAYLDRAGYDTAADGQFGPATRGSVVAFERAEERRANGRASRSEQRLVRARAGAAQAEPESEPAGEEAYLGSDGMAVAPEAARRGKAVIEAGNEIATKPYKYGGGHGALEGLRLRLLRLGELRAPRAPGC